MIDVITPIVNALETSMLDAVLTDAMALPEMAALFGKQSAEQITARLKARLQQWQVADKVQLPAELEDELKTLEGLIQSEVTIERVFSALNEHTALTLNEAKQALASTSHHVESADVDLLLSRWQFKLHHQVQQVVNEQLGLSKNAMLKKLQQKLNQLHKLTALSRYKDKTSGTWWDLTPEQISQKTVEKLSDVADFLSQHVPLVEIAEKIGRTRKPAPAAQSTEHQSANVPQVQASPDNWNGLEQNNALSRTLPSELAMLSDPTLSTVFLQRFAEKQLMCYEPEPLTTQVPQPVPIKNSHQTQLGGPFVVCVDGSASMDGFASLCAKAMAFALLDEAVVQQRECVVSLFSTQCHDYCVSNLHGIEELTHFLGKRFRGGTDFDKAIANALTHLEKKAYQDADLVFISDFVAPKLAEDIAIKLNQFKEKGHRLHALVLSPYANVALLDVFDHQWHYHPSLLQRWFKLK